LNARYYSPDMCTFISQDSYRDLANPATWNMYSYCAGNPVRYTDPSGNIPFDIIWDFISIAASTVTFIQEPSWKNAGYVAQDVGAFLLPYIPATSVAIRGSKVVSEGVGALADTTSAGKKAVKKR